MKKQFYIFLLFFSFASQAQNLIPNGDFELGPDTSSIGWQDGIDSSCTTLANVLGPDFWTVTGGSPDRLFEGNFPSCNWDKDTAQSGGAYAVFGFDFPFGESGKTTLILPLEKDSSYHLSYYVKLETFQGLFSNSGRLAFIFNNNGDSLTSSFISDMLWQYRDTIFTASKNSTEIKIAGIDNVQSGADIDDVKLVKISSVAVVDYLKGKVMKIYPNPIKDSFIIDVAENVDYFYKLFDIAGREMLATKSRGKTKVDVSYLPKGIYILNIKTENGSFNYKIVVQH